VLTFDYHLKCLLATTGVDNRTLKSTESLMKVGLCLNDSLTIKKKNTALFSELLRSNYSPTPLSLLLGLGSGGDGDRPIDNILAEPYLECLIWTVVKTRMQMREGSIILGAYGLEEFRFGYSSSESRSRCC